MYILGAPHVHPKPRYSTALGFLRTETCTDQGVQRYLKHISNARNYRNNIEILPYKTLKAQPVKIKLLCARVGISGVACLSSTPNSKSFL